MEGDWVKNSIVSNVSHHCTSDDTFIDKILADPIRSKLSFITRRDV